MNYFSVKLEGVDFLDVIMINGKMVIGESPLDSRHVQPHKEQSFILYSMLVHTSPVRERYMDSGSKQLTLQIVNNLGSNYHSTRKDSGGSITLHI